MIFIIALPILFLDQLTKYIVTKHLLVGQSIPVVSGIFNITLVHNRGAAFGILKNQTPLFIATSLVAVVLIFLDLKKHSLRRMCVYTAALSLILAGALGNLIDRSLWGYVIDFLDFRVWPVFNVADSSITIGAVMLGITILRNKNHP